MKKIDIRCIDDDHIPGVESVMHYRIRGNNVQIVKTVVDPETKKSKSVPVGSANLKTGKLNANVASALTDAEKRELEAWIAAQHDLRMKEKEIQLSKFSNLVDEVAETIESKEIIVGAEMLDQIEFAIAGLRRTIRRAQAPAA